MTPTPEERFQDKCDQIIELCQEMAECAEIIAEGAQSAQLLEDIETVEQQLEELKRDGIQL